MTSFKETGDFILLSHEIALINDDDFLLLYLSYERVSVRQLGGSGGMLPRENLKLKSSEMARNGSKTAKSEVNF